MNRISFSRIRFNFTIIHHAFVTFIAEFLWIHLLFWKFTVFSLSVTRIHYYSLSITRIHYGFITFLQNSLWIHDRLHKFILNSLWIHFLFANSLWIYNNSREFTMSSANLLLIQYLFRKHTINSLFPFKLHDINSPIIWKY